MKTRSLSSQVNPYQIIAEASSLCSPTFHGTLLLVSNIERTLCRVCQINSLVPSNLLSILANKILTNISNLVHII